MKAISNQLLKWERNGIALLFLSSLFVGVPINQGPDATSWNFLVQLECLYIMHELVFSGLAVLPALVLLASHISLFFLFKLSRSSKAIYFIFFIPLVYQLVFCLIFGPLYLFLVPFFLIWVVFSIIYYVRTKAFKN